MKENKKIKGATPKEYNNIKFRSILECSCYKKLLESGLKFSYEKERITLQEGFYPAIPIYYPNKVKAGTYAKELTLQNSKIRSITYTPDFIVFKGNYRIYIEVKGNPNDAYPRTRKLFLNYLNTLHKKEALKCMFFEPHTVSQMLQAIEIIKKL